MTRIEIDKQWVVYTFDDISIRDISVELEMLEPEFVKKDDSLFRELRADSIAIQEVLNAQKVDKVVYNVYSFFDLVYVAAFRFQTDLQKLSLRFEFPEEVEQHINISLKDIHYASHIPKLGYTVNDSLRGYALAYSGGSLLKYLGVLQTLNKVVSKGK